MIPEIRRRYNEAFTPDRYRAFLEDLHGRHPGAIEFRVAETPVFADKAFLRKMTDTCDSIVDLILDPGFRTLTDAAIPAGDRVPGEEGYPQILTFDFGVCRDEEGALVPRLIEMQGFPTLFGFQVLLPDVLSAHFDMPPGFSHYLGGHDRASYIALLRDVIVGDCDPEEVILLEIKPYEQKTRIDFHCTRDHLGIEPVCMTEIEIEDGKVFYRKEGRRIRVKRIYNRVIFDELHAKRASLTGLPDMTAGWDVEWIPHPNWFYRVSKYTLPFLRDPNVPKTYFLNEVKQLPEDLENYVMKPLFSFAGQGVVIDLTRAELEAIPDPQNWILQRKVTYADAVETPDVPAKAEIRLMYLWKTGDARPQLVTNLARLSKGKMIGVRYNKDKEWVGASVVLFEQ